MSTYNLLLAGFGGQGVLFLGKVAAMAGMIEEKQVTWLPSYGPEMRGGTANCSVTISDELIGSPLVTNPDILVAMNQPSLEKFVDSVAAGGTIIIDSSMVSAKVQRDDVNVCYIPATEMAKEANLTGLTNIILLGKMFKEAPFCSDETIEQALVQSVPPRKSDMIALNAKAFELGLNYK